MFPCKKSVALLVTGLLVLASAAYAAPETSPATQPDMPLDPAVEKACVEFAEKIEAGLNAGKPEALNQGFDGEAFINRVLVGIEFSDKSKTGVHGMLKGISEFGARVCAEINNGGAYKLLRVRSVNGHPRAVFRMLTRGGLNYHEYPLTTTPAGAITFEDIYVYAVGEFLSQTMHRMMLQVAGGEQRGLLDKLSGVESDYVRHLPKIFSMMDGMQAGKFKEALAIYAGLPDSLKCDKAVMVLRFHCAQTMGADSKEYADAMDDFLRFFPGQPWVGLIALDAYVNRKQFDKALAAVDRLDRAVGGDPMLLFMRANIALLQGDIDEAIKLCNAALQAEPDLRQPYQMLVGIHIKRKNFKEVARLLTDLEQKLKVPLADLTQVPDYAEFLKSEEGKQWQTARKSVTPGTIPPARQPRG